MTQTVSPSLSAELLAAVPSLEEAIDSKCATLTRITEAGGDTAPVRGSLLLLIGQRAEHLRPLDPDAAFYARSNARSLLLNHGPAAVAHQYGTRP
jgi:hypothetical protein